MEVVVILILILAICVIIAKIFCGNIKDATRTIVQLAVDIACYVDTYHFKETEEDRIALGQNIFYDTLFDDKKFGFKREKCNFIFEEIYTNFIKKPSSIIPVEMNRFFGRTLSDGEDICSDKFILDFQKEIEEQFKKYATEDDKETPSENINQAK